MFAVGVLSLGDNVCWSVVMPNLAVIGRKAAAQVMTDKVYGHG